MIHSNVPILYGKPSDPAFFNPADWIQYSKGRGQFKKWHPVDACILTFRTDWFKLIKKAFPSHQKLDYDIHLFKIGNQYLAAHLVSVGAAQAGIWLEILIALGIKKFIAIGSAGSIQNHITTGEICLPTKAIRDEGTSFHYIPPSKYSHPNKDLLNQLEKTLHKKNFPYQVGSTWTTDAPYRETTKKINAYRKEGCLTVEMEAASLFAIASHRKVSIASILSISDELTGTHWKPNFHHPKHHESKQKLVEAAIETLTI